eukprot:COSAG02_NODE_6440_length_3568_cov_1.946094_3_plen_59_part_00
MLISTMDLRTPPLRGGGSNNCLSQYQGEAWVDYANRIRNAIISAKSAIASVSANPRIV